MVAQALGVGDRLDELFASAPSSAVLEMLIHKVAKDRERTGLLVLGVKCAFLYCRTGACIQ